MSEQEDPEKEQEEVDLQPELERADDDSQPELEEELQEEDEDQSKSERRQRLLRWWYTFIAHAIGPTLSFAIHALALVTVLVVSVEVSTEILDHSETTVQVLEPDTRPVETPPEPPKIEDEEAEEESEQMELEFDYAATTDTMVDSVSSYSGTQGTAEVVSETVGVQVEMPNMMSVKPGDTAVAVPGIYANRLGKGRNSAVGKFGGSGTSNPVLKALRWLKEKQNNNGSWGVAKGDPTIAMTGFALMCFLAHGETPQSSEFGFCVQGALQWLTGFYYLEPKGEGYAHAIATYALAEAYGMTQIPMLKDSLDSGIDKMVKGMNSVGGYTYKYGVDGRSDLSVSAWNYQAFKAAYAAGCEAPGLEEAMDKAVSCLKNVLHVPGKDSHVGSFAYAVVGDEKAKPGSQAMLGAGTLCLQLLGEGGSPEAMAGYNSIKEHIGPGKIWISYGPEGGGSGLYGWYYLTQALFQATSGTGATWEKWNRQMKQALIGAQQPDGHWEKPEKETHGGKDLDGQLYATTLACLTLEVYYRFLPSFKSTGGFRELKDGTLKEVKVKDPKAKVRHPGAKPKDGKPERVEEDLGLKILDIEP